MSLLKELIDYSGEMVIDSNKLRMMAIALARAYLAAKSEPSRELFNQIFNELYGKYKAGEVNLDEEVRKAWMEIRGEVYRVIEELVREHGRQEGNKRVFKGDRVVVEEEEGEVKWFSIGVYDSIRRPIYISELIYCYDLLLKELSKLKKVARG